MHSFVARQIRALGNPREQGGNPALLLSVIVGTATGVLARTTGQASVGASIAAGTAIFLSTWAVSAVARVRENSDAWYACETFYGLPRTQR